MGKAKRDPMGDLMGVVDEQQQTTEMQEPATESVAVSSEGTTSKPVEPAKVVAVAAKIEEITITLPICRGVHLYAQRHIETKIDPRTAKDLAMVLGALRESGVKMPSGRRVLSTADAVRWILSKVSLECSRDGN
jgi:hypothetical protein